MGATNFSADAAVAVLCEFKLLRAEEGVGNRAAVAVSVVNDRALRDWAGGHGLGLLVRLTERSAVPGVGRFQ